VVQLSLEPLELLVGQPETSEMSDVFDIRARQGGHRPMIVGCR